ncbi:tRNA epoxyqueuosine(34) reductase QueG [Alphaproteobacteria bacterium KMM 3653]|uniref:Epoxyqueuosine reductase n=1 Tax=Harenicola maris TaxID=2841044 RepID=A0AAP2CNC5_9RHOB|nr:tRNA epoxyqueuosine(34) reductase QueG [Harenicola maris]
MPTSTSDLKTRLAAEAAEAGFALCRVTLPAPPEGLAERLAGFTDAGWHGQMAWMEDRQSWRADPRVLWPEVRSIVMLADSYAPEVDPMAGLAHPERGIISTYARGRDYHDTVKKRLKRIARWLVAETGCELKVFVDTAPVAEKPLGQQAGLGWQGKHTNLVSREAGNWFFIGAIYTSLEIEPDTPETDHCGSCRACLDACPTDAFPAPYRLDARRCISYLTIEHKGPVAPELRAKLGNRIYGCDDCLAACPWNKFAVEARELRYAAKEDLDSPDLGALARLDDTEFRAKFSGSPIKRIGRDRFLRNVAYAIGNSGKAELRSALLPLAEDPDPTLAEAAEWALARLPEG